jgi:hypothetical protein
MAGFFEHHDEPSDSIKVCHFLTSSVTNRIGKAYSLECTDSPKVFFTPHFDVVVALM